MGIRELRERYGNGKARAVVNRAIREEIPGGNDALDAQAALYRLRGTANYRDRQDLREAQQAVSTLVAEMADKISRKYGLNSGDS